MFRVYGEKIGGKVLQSALVRDKPDISVSVNQLVTYLRDHRDQVSSLLSCSHKEILLLNSNVV